MKKKYSHDELLKRVKAHGWSHHGEEKITGTLEDAAKAAHAQRKKGKGPGLVKELETAVELEMIELEQLWRYLGLPL